MFLYAAELASMAWFSKIGATFRRYTISITTAGVAAVISVCFYPQTLGLKRYQSLMAHYKDGAAIPVDSEIQQLIEKVHFVYHVEII